MASMWRKTMVYLGLVDDDEFGDYEPYEEPPSPANMRRPLRSERPESLSEPEGAMVSAIRTIPREDTGVTIRERPAVVRPITPVASPRVHVVAPNGFNDAQEIGDKLKANQPVILNLQSVDRELSRRLIDFSSGLAYGLAGQMEKVADQVFLLSPSNMEISPEEKRRLQERGLYRSERS